MLGTKESFKGHTASVLRGPNNTGYVSNFQVMHFVEQVEGVDMCSHARSSLRLLRLWEPGARRSGLASSNRSVPSLLLFQRRSWLAPPPPLSLTKRVPRPPYLSPRVIRSYMTSQPPLSLQSTPPSSHPHFLLSFALPLRASGGCDVVPWGKVSSSRWGTGECGLEWKGLQLPGKAHCQTLKTDIWFTNKLKHLGFPFRPFDPSILIPRI